MKKTKRTNIPALVKPRAAAPKPEAGFLQAAAMATFRNLDSLLDKRSVQSQFNLSEEQWDVLDFLSDRYDTLCLGDTAHFSNHIPALVTDETFQERLAKREIRKVFIEMGKKFNEFAAKLRSGKIDGDEFAKEVYPIGMGWGTTSSSRFRGQRWAEAVKKDVLRYRGVDARDLKNILSPSSLEGGKAVNDAVRAILPNFLPRMLGNFVALQMASVEMGHKKFWRSITDDRRTVNNIMKKISAGERCYIVYGAGHFMGLAQKFGAIDMVTALKNKGRNPVVINIFGGHLWYQIGGAVMKNMMNSPLFFGHKGTKASYKPPDIDFIMEKNGRPGQIVFHNKSLERDYRAQNNPRRGAVQRRLNRQPQAS